MPSYVEAKVKSIVVDPNLEGDAFPVLTFTADGGRNYVYEISEDKKLDLDAVEIPWSYETGYTSNQDGELYTFAGAQVRAAISLDTDNGATHDTLLVEIIPLDEQAQTTVKDITLTSRPKKWYSMTIDMISEQVRIKLSGYNQILVSALSLFVSKKAEGRQRD